MGYWCVGQPTATVSLMPGDQDILARDDSRSTHPVGIPLPPVLRLAEACHHGRTDDIAHDDGELRTHLLRVQHALVRQGYLGRGAFSTQAHRPRSPAAPIEGGPSRPTGHVGETSPMAHGPAPWCGEYGRPRETCALGHIPCGLTALLTIIKQGRPCGVGLGLPAPCRGDPTRRCRRPGLLRHTAVDDLTPADERRNGLARQANGLSRVAASTLHAGRAGMVSWIPPPVVSVRISVYGLARAPRRGEAMSVATRGLLLARRVLFQSLCMSLSQCNHRLPRRETHPDIGQGTAAFHDQITAALLAHLQRPHCDPVAPEPAPASILDTRDLSVVSRLFVPAHCAGGGRAYPDQFSVVLVAAQCGLSL
jgi:hypothetical protein